MSGIFQNHLGNTGMPMHFSLLDMSLPFRRVNSLNALMQTFGWYWHLFGGKLTRVTSHALLSGRRSLETTWHDLVLCICPFANFPVNVQKVESSRPGLVGF